jgi:hypothetical protein
MTAANGATKNDATANGGDAPMRAAMRRSKRRVELSRRLARGEAKKIIRHLRANPEPKRIRTTVFWRLRHRLITIVKM